MKRLAVALLLAMVATLSGCGSDGNATPKPSAPTTQPPAAAHPFEDALTGNGFSLKNMTISNNNTAVIDPHDGTHCQVTVQAIDTSLTTYQVISVDDHPYSALSSDVQRAVGAQNIKADALWTAIKELRAAGKLNC